VGKLQADLRLRPFTDAMLDFEFGCEFYMIRDVGINERDEALLIEGAVRRTDTGVEL